MNAPDIVYDVGKAIDPSDHVAAACRRSREQSPSARHG